VACLHVRIQHELYQLYSYRGFDNLRGGGGGVKTESEVVMGMVG
jgi:hypothetical protein